MGCGVVLAGTGVAIMNGAVAATIIAEVAAGTTIGASATIRVSAASTVAEGALAATGVGLVVIGAGLLIATVFCDQEDF